MVYAFTEVSNAFNRLKYQEVVSGLRLFAEKERSTLERFPQQPGSLHDTFHLQSQSK